MNDTIKAVRATLARDRAEFDQRLKEIETMVKWCCQKPKGTLAAGAAAPPPPTPPPTSTGGYPASIVQAGLQAVYDLKITAGPTGALTRALPADAPGGWSVIVPGTYGAAAGGVLNDLDGRGYDLFLNGGIYSFTNLKLGARTGGQYVLNVADPDYGATATVHVDGAEIDLGNTHNYGRIKSSGVLTINNARITDASITSIESFGTVTVTNSYLKNAGLNPEADPDPHAELFHPHEGVLTIQHCHLRCETGVSLAIHAEGDGGPVTVLIEDSIISVAEAINGLAPIQATSRAYPVTMTLNRCVIKRGTSGGAPYVLANKMGSQPVAVHALNCTDYDTGAAIDAELIAASRL